jgi:hypothetical protein
LPVCLQTKTLFWCEELFPDPTVGW